MSLPTLTHPRRGCLGTAPGIRSLRLLLGWLVLLGSVMAGRADEGHTPIVFEGRVGEYGARIVVRAPPVVPGLAEISVRVLAGDVAKVLVAPIRWNTGKAGAPRPDVARPVRGEPGLHAAELWLMEGGAHVVEVTLEGAAGPARALIPVPALATRVLALPRYLGALLGLLGVVLVALFASIAGAAVREAVLPPGATPDARRRRRARWAVLGTGAGVVALLFGGWRWWEYEAGQFRRYRLYRPMPLGVELATPTPTGPHRLTVTLAERPTRRLAPLVPDHGRLMHLFLVEESCMQAFAHLHPVRSNRLSFVTDLPPLPAGGYRVYGQVTYETGLSETLTARLELPASPPTAGPERPAPDPDDGWTRAEPGAGGRHDLGDGLVMEWMGTRAFPVRVPASLRVRVRQAATDEPAVLEPYLGMGGHLILRGRDGRTFSHVHPGGTFSMASQQVFEARDGVDAPVRIEYGATEPTCRLPTLEEGAARWAARLAREGEGVLAFPFEFAEAGTFRVWVQVRTGGRVRTGVFDVEAVGSGKP